MIQLTKFRNLPHRKKVSANGFKSNSGQNSLNQTLSIMKSRTLIYELGLKLGLKDSIKCSLEKKADAETSYTTFNNLFVMQ